MFKTFRQKLDTDKKVDVSTHPVRARFGFTVRDADQGGVVFLSSGLGWETEEAALDVAASYLNTVWE